MEKRRGTTASCQRGSGWQIERRADAIQFLDKSLSRSAFTPPPTFLFPTTQITTAASKFIGFLSKFVKLLLINLACDLYQFFGHSSLSQYLVYQPLSSITAFTLLFMFFINSSIRLCFILSPRSFNT